MLRPASKYTRESVFHKLEWIRAFLIETGDESLALIEQHKISEAFHNFSVSDSLYGLIHFDFELDNIIYKKDNASLYAIDFDDSMMGWYGMDVERAIDSIYSELSYETASIIEQNFLEGYQSKFLLPDYYKVNRFWFKRFAELYKYTRIKYSLKEIWDNEPEWVITLRKKLTNKLEIYLEELQNNIKNDSFK